MQIWRAAEQGDGSQEFGADGELQLKAPAADPDAVETTATDSAKKNSTASILTAAFERVLSYQTDEKKRPKLSPKSEMHEAQKAMLKLVKKRISPILAALKNVNLDRTADVAKFLKLVDDDGGLGFRSVFHVGHAFDKATTDSWRDVDGNLLPAATEDEAPSSRHPFVLQPYRKPDVTSDDQGLARIFSTPFRVTNILEATKEEGGMTRKALAKLATESDKKYMMYSRKQIAGFNHLKSAKDITQDMLEGADWNGLNDGFFGEQNRGAAVDKIPGYTVARKFIDKQAKQFARMIVGSRVCSFVGGDHCSRGIISSS